MYAVHSWMVTTAYRAYQDSKPCKQWHFDQKINEFYNEYIKGTYQNNLIVMDNAKFHKSKETVENITKSKNKILNILPYNSQLNPIKNLFSQLSFEKLN